MIEIEIALSGSSDMNGSEKKVARSRKGSGKRGAGDGQRLPRQADNGELHDETVEEFKHRQKKRGKKPKRDLAIPRSGTTNQDPGSTRDVFVKKEIWLGRRERDPTPPRGRIIVGGPKGKI